MQTIIVLGPAGAGTAEPTDAIASPDSSILLVSVRPAGDAREVSPTAAVVVEGPSVRPNAPLLLTPEGLANAPALRVGVSDLPAAHSPVPGAARDEVMVPVPTPPTPRAPPASPGAPANPPRQAARPPALPAVQGAGMLAVIPPLDLAALELGLQRFLEQFGPGGHPPGEASEGTGLWPWLVAGVGAAAACEIGRRQLRQAARRAAEETEGLSGRAPGSILRDDHERAPG